MQSFYYEENAHPPQPKNEMTTTVRLLSDRLHNVKSGLDGVAITFGQRKLQVPDDMQPGRPECDLGFWHFTEYSILASARPLPALP